MPAVYKDQEVVYGLDIGTRSVVGTVGYKDARNRFQVVAQEECFHDTRAMLDGQIHDIARVSETITEVTEKLEKRLSTELKEVCIAAAGRVLKTAIGHAEDDLEGEGTVTEEMIYSLDMLAQSDASDQVRSESEDDTRFIAVGYTPVRYYLNGNPITSLEGHTARKIGADILATFLPDDVIDGLYKACEGAGLTVVNLTLEPIAAMNVAIPEQYRLLNIALVDVGAGTSDICISRDGTIVAYGMIPYAGDKLTEVLVQKYLVDFDTAEKMKLLPPTRKICNYTDIMGDRQKVTRVQIEKDLAESVKTMASKAAERIVELNGGRSVSAVFVVGGGGKVDGYCAALAKALKLPPNRVALRGREVMGDIDLLDEHAKKDSLYVTPVGICINYYENRNNFIFVHVNQTRVKLYNNDHLTVMDAAAAASFPNVDLFAKRGADLTYTLNEKRRIVMGQRGEPAAIYLNGSQVSMTSPVHADDRIVIEPSTAGEPAHLEIHDIPEAGEHISFRVNNETVTCPKLTLANGEMVGEYYSVSEGDSISILDYYTVDQLKKYMDLPTNISFYVNHEAADLHDKIYGNYMINWIEKGQEQKPAAAAEVETDTEATAAENENVTEKKPDREPENPRNLSITVNGENVVLSGKARYTFVDILDFYPFDTSVLKGTELATELNGHPAAFTDPLHESDEAAIYWKN